MIRTKAKETARAKETKPKASETARAEAIRPEERAEAKIRELRRELEEARLHKRLRAAESVRDPFKECD